MGYTAQFNLLSPCYKDGEQPAGFHMGGVKVSKKGKKETTKTKKPSTKKLKSSKQRGGSSCYASPSVAEMGVVATPASLEPTKSELAWDNRMKGGQGNTALAQAPAPAPAPAPAQAQSPNNLFSINFNQNTSLNTNNGSLNKIKNKILPEGTISGLAMKLIKISKNNKNPSNDKYSFEIIYKIDGNNEIKKSVGSNVEFLNFLTTYQGISKTVFPPPPKANLTKQNTQTVQVPAPAPSTNTTIGGRKRKNNHK